jgi:hypothetical protein
VVVSQIGCRCIWEALSTALGFAKCNDGTQLRQDHRQTFSFQLPCLSEDVSNSVQTFAAYHVLLRMSHVSFQGAVNSN